MGTDLEAFTSREVATIKAVLAPGVSDDELALFAKVCAGLGLSPFRDEVALVGRWSKDAGRKVYKHQVTVHGRRVLAARTGELRGIVGPEWCGAHAPNPDSPLRWEDVWLNDEPPHAARATVHRAGHEPYVGTVPWREFAQRNKDGELTGLWPAMPAHMLGKVAEALALRRAFPEVITEAVATEFDEYDADESTGGAQGAVEVGMAPSPPRHAPHEVVVPNLATRSQARVLVALRERVGMAGPDSEAAWLAYVSNVVGRPIVTTAEVTRSEADSLRSALLAKLASMASTPEGPDLVTVETTERPPEEPEVDGG